MKRNKPLSFEERKQIEKLLQDDRLSLSQISRLIQRGKNTVVFEVRRAGGRGNYTAEKAEKEFYRRRKEGYEKLSLHNITTTKEIKLNNLKRIESLEMQIEILIDTITELRSK